MQKHVRPHKIKEGKGKFCSVTCYNIHKKTPEHKDKIKNWWITSAVNRTGVKMSEERILRHSMAIKKAWKNGSFSGFKGHRHSELEKQRRSFFFKGRKTPWSAGCKNWNWRGGTTTPNQRIRNSPKYENWRTLIFNRDQFTCQVCQRRGGNINAHHIRSFSTHPRLRFSVSNGMTACIPCHRLIHSTNNAIA